MKSSCSECGTADVPNHLKTVKRPLTVDHAAAWLLYDAGHVCIQLPNGKYANEVRRAVNAFPALVEAVRNLKEALVSEMNNPGLHGRVDVIAEAIAALKLAEGK